MQTSCITKRRASVATTAKSTWTVMLVLGLTDKFRAFFRLRSSKNYKNVRCQPHWKMCLPFLKKKVFHCGCFRRLLNTMFYNSPHTIPYWLAKRFTNGRPRVRPALASLLAPTRNMHRKEKNFQSLWFFTRPPKVNPFYDKKIKISSIVKDCNNKTIFFLTWKKRKCRCVFVFAQLYIRCDSKFKSFKGYFCFNH